jgi:DNA/RNA-binding domain of Phe-tRNA-synthetase-like protein
MAMLTIQLEPHASLKVKALVSNFRAPIGSIFPTDAVIKFLNAMSAGPLRSDDRIRADVRDMLRQGGYKPTGRGKPASEYLLRASSDGTLKPINAAIDICNVVSLHSGLPISVVDLELATPPFRIGVARADEKYVFNASGQEIDLTGLVCLFDQRGPCANAVKDSQRTKTQPETRSTLSILWGTSGLITRLGEAADWYRELSLLVGADCSVVDLLNG